MGPQCGLVVNTWVWPHAGCYIGTYGIQGVGAQVWGNLVCARARCGCQLWRIHPVDEWLAKCHAGCGQGSADIGTGMRVYGIQGGEQIGTCRVSGTVRGLELVAA